MGKLEGIKGLRFGKLTTTGKRKKFPKGNKGIYAYKEECLCDCGNIIYANKSDLKKGRTKSCGCLFKEKNTISGDSGTPFYNLWIGIKQRCYAKTCKDYINYGGRGIKCEWGNYLEFKKDMFDSYKEHIEKYGKKNTTIDRIDNNGNYCKSNCRRATMKEQCNNTRYNRECIYKGKKYKSLMLLCEDLGIKGKYTLIRKRAYRGQSVDYAVDQIISLYYKNKNDNCN